MKCKCPLCGGTGIAETKPPRKADAKRKIAIKMRSQGFTFRQIAKALGYTSPSPVAFLLK